ncbi:MAG: response regulator [Ignavibacteriales bacterium]|nr:MAG: response regulator [Ignavibacteriales bacterium]
MRDKIVVVEDDPFSKDFYKIIFNRAGYETIVLEDGNEVLKTISENKISLVIMDINLKNTYLDDIKIDGIKLSRTIKEDIRFSNIPIILVSAYSDTYKDANLLDDSRADDFITKPIIDFNVFLKKINSFILA